MAFTPVTSPNPYTFTFSDNVNLSSVDSNWTNQDGISGHVGVSSNQIYSAYAATSDVCWVGAGSFDADQYATIKVVGSVTDLPDKIGVSVRNNGAVSASRSLYRAYVWDPTGGGDAEQVVTEKIVSGGAPTTLQTSTETFASGDTLTLSVVTDGSNAILRTYKNGVQFGGDITDSSSPLTSGKPGLVAAGNAATLFGDDFVGGNVTASTTQPKLMTLGVG
jgi:hypothetical protein